jgi:hypothetical protein
MICLICSDYFERRSNNQKYCSSSCNSRAKYNRFIAAGRNYREYDKVCLECQTNFKTKLFDVKLCSTKCIAAYNSRILSKFLDIPSCIEGASRKLDKTLGYVRVYAPMHPEANTWGYVYEHRLIAENIIGRRLEMNEIVHHKNGKRWDNRPENLEVMDKNDHARLHGQRPEDLET